MPFKLESTHLDAVKVLVPEVVRDARGHFMEAYRADRFSDLGITAHFVQDNESRSRRGVLRGLHFQWDPPMAKLMRVTSGRALLVAVDLRKGSPTVGQWQSVEASAEDRRQVWAPAGFARGFCVLSEFAEVLYKCSALYNPDAEGGIRWNDPTIGIEWPIGDPILSAKDASAQSFAEWMDRPESEAFRYEER